MRLGVFIRAARLPFLTGSLMPVALAGALAVYQGTWSGFWYFLITAVGVAGLHTGGNLINDYYDSFGSDPLNRYATPYSGGSRVIQQGELSAAAVRQLAYLCLGVGILAGLILVSAGRPWVALLGLFGLAAAYLYSAAPVQLMSKGLGEMTIFLAFGPLLTLGAYYACTGQIATVAFYLGLPLAFLITAILWINEFPDQEADAAAAKEHLVVRLGLERSRQVYAGLMLAPFVSLALLVPIFHLPGHLFAGLVALPPAVSAVRQVWQTDPREEEFVSLQALTIKVHFLLSLALTLALLYAAWLG
ncbi:MAG: prenyltransferase [Desulfobacca sp.]|uniref:prenyltransferase n=1 Tax=Desulfobacca sp. TaxID=2067990 RepID=UPI004049A253